MNSNQLRFEIVRPALRSIHMHSQAAENLIMGTAAQESRLEYVRQLDGPALSLFQIEPATYHDYWDKFLEFRPTIEMDILRAIATDRQPPADRLIWDIRFATIMCRIHYRRISDALPDPHDVWGMAHYWKRYYNTEKGAGTVDEFVKNYRLVQISG